MGKNVKMQILTPGPYVILYLHVYRGQFQEETLKSNPYHFGA